MNELIVSDKWMFLLLALSINLFASFTMFSMIGQLKQAGRPRHYWLMSGAAVYALGLWVCHFIMMLATGTMVVIDWTSAVKLAGVMSCAYLSFRLIGSGCPFAARWLPGSLIMALGTGFLNYSELMSGHIQGIHVQAMLASVAFVVSLMGTACAFYIFERNNGTHLVLPGLLLGTSGIAMQLIAIVAITVSYSVVMTADRLNDNMQSLAVLLGIATLVIYAFSLLARFADKRYSSVNERYRQLVENSIDMIAIVRDECWEYINGSGLHMFEADQDADMLGKPIYGYLDPRYHGQMKAMLKMTEQGIGHGPIELLWHTVKGKPLHTEVVETCTRLSGRPVLQMIVRDISERKKNEELLINSEKLYVAGQLAAGIAHEIRNPLTSLKGFLHLLSTGRQGNKSYYDIMKSELNRIESIVSELLMLSKPQIYDLATFDIRDIIGDTITLLEAQAILHNIEIEIEFADEGLPVRGVENQLKQVFINIVKNAIEAMDNGGRIIIGCQRQRDRVFVRIADHGPGIPEEQLEKIGQPFYTTKEKGTGLGLMVSYKIVHNHEGTIRFDSKPGEGTTFEITLPYYGENGEADGPPADTTDGKVTPINRSRPGADES